MVHIGKYTVIKELGQGREGRVYAVKDAKGNVYALKKFASRKSVSSIINEAHLQTKAHLVGVAPRVVSIDTDLKFILMEKLDMQLIEAISRSKGVLSKARQLEMVRMFKSLDIAKVFHADANISNYMIHGGKIMLVDYGMSKKITPALVKKLRTSSPNVLFMAISLVLSLQQGGCPPKSYKWISDCI